MFVPVPAELDHGLSEPQIRCIAHQTLLALECLHSNGCIHRDLKAGNVLLCSDGSIRLGNYRGLPIHGVDLYKCILLSIKTLIRFHMLLIRVYL